ncbi:MucBP domain-containing protein [Levilactobacillus brevis]|uniref:MucBP domain-containing protein n=1 Tax=Levilactobacillus brevis TaxID=1580 RepID=UPI001BDE12EF|nr:DUF5776 domain-containing protein [Levilactobacillus brevis]
MYKYYSYTTNGTASITDPETGKPASSKSYYLELRKVVDIPNNDVTITQNATWDASKFVTIYDHDGKSVSLNSSDVKIDGTVDTSKPGKYEVTYTYLPDGTSKKLKVTVTSPESKPGAVTVHYQDPAGKEILDNVVLTGNKIGDSYTDQVAKLKKDIPGYTFQKASDNVSGQFAAYSQDVTYTYTKDKDSTTGIVQVNYTDENGNLIKASQIVSGTIGDAYTSDVAKLKEDIPGYTFKEIKGNAEGVYAFDSQRITYVYTRSATPTPTPTPVVKKGTVVYALKKIGLYSQKNFSNKTRKVWYHQKSRINRPMFVVKGYATSAKGHLRYLVKDVNHHSKTAGKTGYITANGQYTLPVYYAGAPRKITVINPQGINAYRNAKLSGKSVHYKQGIRLTIEKIVKHHLTTRFVLSNGRYITANKKLVISGTYKMPTKVQAKGALNRYNDVNLRHKNRHYAAKRHQTFKVLGWDYSNADNFNRGDSLRYRVAGGYITANKHLVKAIR